MTHTGTRACAHTDTHTHTQMHDTEKCVHCYFLSIKVNKCLIKKWIAQMHAGDSVPTGDWVPH